MRAKPKVRPVVGVSAALFAATASMSVASAAQAVCTHIGPGQNYGIAREDGQDWGYSLTVRGDRWERMPYGWHAPGAFSCKTCRTHGLFRFFAHEIAPPATAAERIARGSETFGYPRLQLGAADLVPIASRGDLRTGTFTGYAVRYRPEAWRLPKLSPYQSFLVIALTDGCIHLDAMLGSEGIPADWTDVESLVAAISIERHSGAETWRQTPSASDSSSVLSNGRMHGP